MSENRLFLGGEENKYIYIYIYIALLSQGGRSIASIVKYLHHSFFYIINYFGFIFTSAYNSILFCYLRRNVEPCCHAHDSRSCIARDSAWSVSHCIGYPAWRLVGQYPHRPTRKANHRCDIQPSWPLVWPTSVSALVSYPLQRMTERMEE